MTTQPPSAIERYASIDVLRGFALFMNVFVHLFTDVMDLNPITSNLSGLPLSILLIFIAIGYFGSYGSFFILISCTGNMLSMQNGYAKGKSPAQVAGRQIVGGIILLIFSMAVEGTFQFYGFFGTFFSMNSHAFDPTRMIWHAYSVTPVTCLGMTIIITGIIEFFLGLNEGHRKYIRNIFIYIGLSMVVVLVSQPIWDWCKAIGPAGFPNASWGNGLPGDYKVYMPPPDASFFDYGKYFVLAMCGGSNHPLFPYLAMGFVGNIGGILLIRARNSPAENEHMPRNGMMAGVVVFIMGVLAIPLLGVDFGSVLPVDNVGDITGIHGGRDAFWLPWWCFLLAGQIFLLFLLIRLIEYRGIGEMLANKTTFIRRFGMPAFSVYAWHRFWAIPIVIPLSYLAGNPSWPGGSITETSLNWAWTLVICAIVWIWCGLLLKAWEKVGYIGGIEWMMASVAAMLGPNFRKTKGSQKEHARWWEHGKMEITNLFYHPRWIDIFPANEQYHTTMRDSKLSWKISLMGLFFGLFGFFALPIAKTSEKTEGKNNYNRKAITLAIIELVISAFVIGILSLLTLNSMGISL
jgi:hypothetical protein